MFRKTLSWKTTIAGLATIALFVAVSPALAVKATGFTSSGALISNWYWLRQPGATARWDFGPTPEAKSSTGCDVWIDSLSTNTTSGGSGHDKHIDLTLSSGGLTHTFPVFLDNPNPVTETDSKGAGYGGKPSGPLRTFLLVSELTSQIDKKALVDICGKYRDTGKLTISYTWKSTAGQELCCSNLAKRNEYTHHVAFNKDSMQVFFYYDKR